MAYLPSAIIALVVGACVIFGMRLTHESSCLQGLWALFFAYWTFPSRGNAEEEE